MSRYSESPSWHERVRSQAADEKEIENVRKAFVDRQPMGRIGSQMKLQSWQFILHQ